MARHSHIARNIPETPLPPVGEEIHLPDPSIVPLFTAAAIALIVIGLAVAWWISIVGGVLFLVCATIWVRDTRHELDELPPTHHR
jgi:hypothetical protein